MTGVGGAGRSPTATGAGAGIGLALVFGTALVSGISTFVNFYAVQGTSSDAFVTVRNLVAALLLLPLAWVGHRTFRGRLARADWGRLALIGLVGGAIPFLLFFHGLALATVAGGAATASFAYRGLFLAATVLGVVFLRERLRWQGTVAAALLLGGNVLLLSFYVPLWTPGTAYVLAATLLWAGEYTLSRRTLRDLPSSTVALGRMGFGVAFLGVYLAFTDQVGRAVALSGAQWEWVGISALLLAAFVATWYAGLKRIEVGPATSVLVLGFPVTFVLESVFAGTPFTLAQAAGAAVVTVGVGVAVGWGALRQAWRAVAARGRPTA
ncbi:membrane protein containing DUF6, transmembrane [mine drainage metagenome]|uniref:Membrane protein containing DUF6, transmembrane n=1 Tax=mine drainage metagenome TaxID=410659 RepID=T1BZ13_9ZZZZ